MEDYYKYLHNKVHSSNNYGFESVYVPDFLFDFQKMLVEWALLKGRGAIFADCGLGKSPMELVLDHVLPYREGRDEEDEKHVHPLQLDVINRVVVLRSNPGEIVFTPFMGVGSEVFGAVMNDRKGVGVELKESYYRQAIKNMKYVEEHKQDSKEVGLFDSLKEDAI